MYPTRVYIGADHAGLRLKTVIIKHLINQGYEVIDVGPQRFNATDDYPVYCLEATVRVLNDCSALGIIVGANGIGEQIACNKVNGSRTALVWSIDAARLAREHLDANVIVLGSIHHDDQTALRIVDASLTTPFSGDLRHQRRLIQVADYELTRHLPYARTDRS